MEKTRGPGRPPLVEGEESRRRMVRLPMSLDEEADRVRGQTPWSEWLRGLVEDAVRRAGLAPRRGS